MIIKDLENLVCLLHSNLKNEVLGQNHIYPSLLNFFRRGESGLTDPKLPKGSFVSLGSTGVGKTETVKVVARDLFGDDVDTVVRLNMSEYKSLTDMAQFLGTANSKGDLQTRLEKAGESGRILLLDEIEKAHSAFFDLLLQILDEAHIRFYNGDTFNFSNYYIWCTSNIGSDLAQKGTKTNKKTLQIAYENAFRQFMRPELVERFSEILPYYSLTMDVQIKISEVLLFKELSRLQQCTGLSVDMSDQVKQTMINEIRSLGFTEGLGARRMRKVTQNFLEMAFYEALVKGLSGQLRLDYSNEKVNLTPSDLPRETS